MNKEGGDVQECAKKIKKKKKKKKKIVKSYKNVFLLPTIP